MYLYIGSKRARVVDIDDDSWDDFIPIAAAKQYRNEMKEQEAKMEEDDAGDGVHPKKREKMYCISKEHQRNTWT